MVVSTVQLSYTSICASVFTERIILSLHFQNPKVGQTEQEREDQEKKMKKNFKIK